MVFCGQSNWEFIALGEVKILGVNRMTYTQYVAVINVACNQEKLAMWMLTNLVRLFYNCYQLRIYFVCMHLHNTCHVLTVLLYCCIVR